MSPRGPDRLLLTQHPPYLIPTAPQTGVLQLFERKAPFRFGCQLFDSPEHLPTLGAPRGHDFPNPFGEFPIGRLQDG